MVFCLWEVGFILITDILITSLEHSINISNTRSYGNVRVPCWKGVQRVLHVVLFLLKNCPMVFLMASGLCGTGPSVWEQRDSYPGMAPSRDRPKKPSWSFPRSWCCGIPNKSTIRSPGSLGTRPSESMSALGSL